MNWDPITRIVGSLGIFTKIDFGNREVVECYSTSSIFRGYSIFMKGKDPRDAHFITSRICGICGDNHATCAVLRPEHGLRHQAAGDGRMDRQPGRSGRVHVRPQHLPGQPGRRRFLRADGEGNEPRRLAKGRANRGPERPIHGYKTIADIMRALNPFTGEFYRETLQVSRMTREMFCLMEGRHVHPSTLYPGGVGTVPTVQLFTDYLVAPDAVRRVHEEVPAAARRPVQLLVRGAARLRRSRPAADSAGLLGLVPGSRRLRLQLQER